ncbi:hypothetical protein DMZ43_08215 [Meridianimaribacter sp. CL38]|nr:hypothetical protein DMZ43_08215 [Meridianimaribacter sp. CL38]
MLYFCIYYFIDNVFLIGKHMSLSRTINFILILSGGIIAIYAKAGDGQSVYLLMAGIVLLMMGIYRTSRNIPSKYKNDDTNESDNDTAQ